MCSGPFFQVYEQFDNLSGKNIAKWCRTWVTWKVHILGREFGTPLDVDMAHQNAILLPSNRCQKAPVHTHCRPFPFVIGLGNLQRSRNLGKIMANMRQPATIGGIKLEQGSRHRTAPASLRI